MRKNIKTIAAIVTAAVLAISASACGGKNTAEKTEAQTSAETAEKTEAAPAATTEAAAPMETTEAAPAPADTTAAESDAVTEDTSVSEEAVEEYDPAVFESNFKFINGAVLGDGIKITQYIGTDEHVFIPASAAGIPITEAYLDNPAVTETEFDPNFTEISGSSHLGLSCENVTSIILPASLTSLKFVFCACPKLTSIVVPNGITEITECEFQGCKSLTDVTLPDGIVKIGWQAFMSCDSLKSVNIPDGVTEIEKGTFFDCRALESLVLPDSVTTIGENAFFGCSSLKGTSKNRFEKRK